MEPWQCSLICYKILLLIFRVRSPALSWNWLFQFILFIVRQWLESLTGCVHCAILSSFVIIWQLWCISNRGFETFHLGPSGGSPFPPVAIDIPWLYRPYSTSGWEHKFWNQIYLGLSLNLVTYRCLVGYLIVLCLSFFIFKMKHLFSVLVLKIC